MNHHDPYLRGLRAALAVSGGVARRTIRPLGYFLLVSALYGAHVPSAQEPTSSQDPALLSSVESAVGLGSLGVLGSVLPSGWSVGLAALGQSPPGCIPWGPPAPPSLDATTLEQLCAALQAEEA